MIFDTDALIWFQRGSDRAARAIQNADERYISVRSYMELLQCASSKDHLHRARRFLKDLSFHTLPLTENIGHRAAVYIEEYALSHGMRVGDAIVAATAAESSQGLCTSNRKHYRHIPDLKLHALKP